jgi:hypothetical protein
LIFQKSCLKLAGMSDPLMALFLVGLLAASGAYVGMARAASKFAARPPATAGASPHYEEDLLDDYRQACAESCRAPLLLYVYRGFLCVGLGALLLAFL